LEETLRHSEISSGTIDLVRDGRVGRIVLNWPERRNALSLAMWESIPQRMAELARDPDLSVVIVQGAEDQSFAAGADIVELESCLGSEEMGRAYMSAVEHAERAISSFGAPVIAVVKGYCIGAGLEIAMACDLRIATDDSVFAAPPARLGANYSFDSTRRLVELVGMAKAKDMLFSGRRLDAAAAHKIGLVDFVHNREKMEEEVGSYVETLLSNSQYSIKVAKETVEDVRRGILAESDRIRSLRSHGFVHADFREGISAFRERRKPNYLK
jgi:enoyl-CoA hydratase/carnithine racemase